MFVTKPLWYNMTLELIINIFQTYLMPIFAYCAAIWINDMRSENAKQKLNAIFTNYIKRYLGIPKHANNAALHYYCGTWPLFYALKNQARAAVQNIKFPSNCLDGYQPTFANPDPLAPYVPEIEMPNDFPRKKVHFSRNRFYRKKQFSDIFNINHHKLCSIEKFHTQITLKCKCTFCGHALDRGHSCP